MAFSLQFMGDGLFRRRWHIEWAEPMLQRRASELGWDERHPLHFFDRDGVSLGGFVPIEWRPGG